MIRREILCDFEILTSWTSNRVCHVHWSDDILEGSHDDGPSKTSWPGRRVGYGGVKVQNMVFLTDKDQQNWIIHQFCIKNIYRHKWSDIKNGTTENWHEHPVCISESCIATCITPIAFPLWLSIIGSLSLYIYIYREVVDIEPAILSFCMSS